MNTDDFNNLIKPLADKWVDDLVKDGLFNKDETNTVLEQNNTEVKEHYCPISPEQYEKLYKEKEMLESKINDLYPYCCECGAEYDYVDKPCCQHKSISYTHPRLLHKLKVSKFYLQKVSETNQIVNMMEGWTDPNGYVTKVDKVPQRNVEGLTDDMKRIQTKFANVFYQNSKIKKEIDVFKASQAEFNTKQSDFNISILEYINKIKTLLIALHIMVIGLFIFDLGVVWYIIKH